MGCDIPKVIDFRSLPVQVHENIVIHGLIPYLDDFVVKARDSLVEDLDHRLLASLQTVKALPPANPTPFSLFRSPKFPFRTLQCLASHTPPPPLQCSTVLRLPAFDLSLPSTDRLSLLRSSTSVIPS